MLVHLSYGSNFLLHYFLLFVYHVTVRFVFCWKLFRFIIYIIVRMSHYQKMNNREWLSDEKRLSEEWCLLTLKTRKH